MNIEIGNKPIDFVFQGDELIYPSYVAKDNLVLHYDFSGRTNLDVKKGIAEDLSGNGNDGILENFAYESGSGYESNSYLKFDNVDDFITIPELNLDVNNFTVAVDGEVLSYRGDNVAKINENGLEIGGRNLFSKKTVISTDYSAWQKPTHTNNGITNIGVGWDLDVKNYFPNFFKENGAYTISGYYNHSDVTFNRQCVFYINGSQVGSVASRVNPTYFSFNINIDDYENELLSFKAIGGSYPATLSFFKIEKGNKATDWSPAPEDFQTTRITPFFSNKIKTLMYWNRALTDTELQEVYNVQKHRT